MDIESSQVFLNNGLTFLYVVSAVLFCIIGYYFIKLLKDLSVLAKNVNETSQLLNSELKPTLKELNDTMKSINSIVQNTDEGMDNVKTGINNAISKTKSFSGSLISGFVKGFSTIYSIFAKKK